MTPEILDDPNHWRARAEEARTLADQMGDEKSKQTMLRIAADYERMAEHAADRSRLRSKHAEDRARHH